MIDGNVDEVIRLWLLVGRISHKVTGHRVRGFASRRSLQLEHRLKLDFVIVLLPEQILEIETPALLVLRNPGACPTAEGPVLKT